MKKIILSVLALIIALMSTAVAVFGWLTVGTQIQPNYTGSVLSSYFASGDGLTKEKAFEINRPNHLYNLAWLQNNGYFGSTQYYFEITDNLNMSGYVLPPIGTKAKPFIGILDGNKKTISNLTVSNVEADSSKPNEVSPVPKNISENAIGNGYTDIVGFFGVIGHYPGADTCPKNVSVSNLYLDNLTVRTRTENTLIGLFAGYVCGNVNNVGVYRSMVSIGSKADKLNSTYSAHSNYSLIGDFDKNSTGWKDTESGSSEEGAGFGGSIDMQLLSRRVNYMTSRMLNTVGATPSIQRYMVNENTGYNNASQTCYTAGTSFNINTYKYSATPTTLSTEFYWKSGFLGTTYTLTSHLLNHTYLPLNVDLTAMGLDSDTEITLGTTEGWTDKKPTGYHSNLNYLSSASEIISNSNTGYIVGGASSDTASSAYVQLQIQPLNYGGSVSTNQKTIFKSLRFSYESGGYTNSVYGNKVTYEGTNLDLLTNIGGTFFRITDQYNSQETSNAVLNNESVSSENFVRYKDVRDQFGVMLEKDLIYGLHFVNAINTNAHTQGSNVTIDGTKYDLYEFVNSSINFNLRQSGYMTVVLGGYESSTSITQEAFSLYKVNRNNVSGETLSSTISSIEEITSIWVNNSNSKDIRYNLDSSTEYKKVYDKSWYNSHIAAGTAYYAEIPLTAGDYCLGGVSSNYSAYLMYLDIGANGAEGGSSGGETETTYTIESVRFVYLLNGDYDTLSDFYAFQIVRNETGVNNSGVQIYFLMTSSAMCYYKDPIYDTANTEVNLTDATLSVTTNDSSLKTDYGVTTYPPS
ncbi:MAG: hypothetical protein ACI4MQ_01970 [Candidatus Coproplasma sp.]